MIQLHDLAGNEVHFNPRFIVSVQAIPEKHRKKMAEEGNFLTDGCAVELFNGERLIAKENVNQVLSACRG